MDELNKMRRAHDYIFMDTPLWFGRILRFGAGKIRHLDLLVSHHTAVVCESNAVLGFQTYLGKKAPWGQGWPHLLFLCYIYGWVCEGT